MVKDEYYTFYDYMKQANLTASEEDYLEMIYRLMINGGEDVRVKDLAKALNIKSPSVTSMMRKLNLKKLIVYEPYGKVALTRRGKQIGALLYNRHEVIYNFLDIIGVEENKLAETEKMEHMISQETMERFEELVYFFETHPEIYQIFQEMKKRQ